MTAMFAAPEPEPVNIESLLSAGLDGPDAVATELDALSDSQIRDLIDRSEISARQLGALQVAILDQIESRGIHSDDGHHSAKVMVRHLGRLSAGEAAGREKARRLLRRLSAVAEAYSAGEVGIEQVRLLGRVNANRRVAPYMVDYQDWFVEQARVLEYVEFEEVIRAWERLIDQDGAHRAAQRAHLNRDYQMVQDHFGLGWEIRGGTGSVDGAAMYEIFEHPPDSTAPRFVHNVKWDRDSFEKMLESLDGRSPQPLDLDSVCETIDGIPIAPTEAIANALVTEFRRVIVDSAGTVIDLGVARRLTGSARLAAQLLATRCGWIGCLVRTGQCQIDHVKAHSRGGSTSPGNGEPLCGWHNREKERGFTVWRDPQGNWHTHRPDGTEIS